MNAGMNYSQRDIVLLPFPYSDLSGSKKRPAIVISNNNLSGKDIICCLITSHSPNDGFPIEDDSFEEGNLPFKSWIKPYRIFTIEKNSILKKLAKVKKDYYKKVFDAMCFYIK